jgi:hypothetical protein
VSALSGGRTSLPERASKAVEGGNRFHENRSRQIVNKRMNERAAECERVRKIDGE